MRVEERREGGREGWRKEWVVVVERMRGGGGEAMLELLKVGRGMPCL